MPNGVSLIEYPVFDLAALNLKASKVSLARDELTLNNNFSYVISGGLVKEPGYTRFPSGETIDNNKVVGLYDFQQKNGNRYFLRVKSNKLQKYDTGTSTWTDIGTLPATPSLVTFATLADLCVICSSSFAPQKFDGTTLAALGGSPPTGSLVVAHGGRLWIANITGSELTLRCSGQGTPEVWTVPASPVATDPASIPINARGRTQQITGLLPYFNRMMIGMDDGYFEIRGGGTGTFGATQVGASGINPYASDFAIVPVNLDIGLVNQRASVQVSNEWYFMSFKGIHHLSTIIAADLYANVKETYLSAPIETEFNNLNRAQLANVVVVHRRARNEIWWIVPTGSNQTNNAVFAYDYYHSLIKQKPVWTLYQDYPFSSAAEVEVNPNELEVYLGAYNGTVQKSGGDSHDGATFGATVRYTTALDLPNWQKTFRHVLVFFEEQTAQTVQVTPIYDFYKAGATITVTLTGASTFIMPVILPAALGKQDVITKLIHLNGIGRWLTLEFQVTSGTAPVKILGFIIFAEPRRRIV